MNRPSGAFALIKLASVQVKDRYILYPKVFATISIILIPDDCKLYEHYTE